MAKDYYKILGVDKNASPEEIKKAFRRLAHEHHPDKGGEANKFKDINEAYQVLSDDKKRAQYDQFGSAVFENGGMGGPGGFGGFGGFGQQAGGGFEVNMEDLGDFGDILGGMFGFGGGRRQREVRGQDIQVDVTLNFLETITGATKKVKLYKHEPCTKCAGSGGEPGTVFATCKTCGGKGRVEKAQRTIFGNVQVAQICPDCHGRGKIPEKTCSVCKGIGIERREKEIEIRIPAGVSDGESLKVEGEGEHPGRGGRPGDLFVRLRILKHPTFIREGNDILSSVQVPFSLMSLGGSIDIETVDGPGALKIPEGTKAGTVFKLRGKGVPFLRTHGRGDHFVTVQPEVKDRLTKEQKKILEDLRDAGM